MLSLACCHGYGFGGQQQPPFTALSVCVLRFAATAYRDRGGGRNSSVSKRDSVEQQRTYNFLSPSVGATLSTDMYDT